VIIIEVILDLQAIFPDGGRQLLHRQVHRILPKHKFVQPTRQFILGFGDLSSSEIQGEREEQYRKRTSGGVKSNSSTGGS
jgi:hypothetical protein